MAAIVVQHRLAHAIMVGHLGMGRMKKVVRLCRCVGDCLQTSPS